MIAMRESRYFDDDPPPPRIRLWGDMRVADWRELRTTAEIRREASDEGPASTAGQRVRRRRNLIILLCHEVGLSSRQIGEVFGVTKTRVNEIIAETRDRP
jgi:DNA-directed RNA polymerase specialized sigma24 family protein